MPKPSPRTLIVIPARYGSSRFPGKPLADIAGVSMVMRVATAAKEAVAVIGDAAFVVATDDARIEDHCRRHGAPVVMTDPALPSGSDRARAAADAVAPACDFIINLQGDAPFTPASHAAAVANLLQAGACDIATPVIRLDWQALDALRAAKITTPHSGTTALIAEDGCALWFSKNILPALRNEAALRRESELSPVYRHVGLYGYTRKALQKFTQTPVSRYEALEGLEQLRALEAGMVIRCAVVQPPDISTSGVDTIEDLARLNKLLSDRAKDGNSSGNG